MKISIVISIVCFLLLFISLVSAIPQLPMILSGEVIVDSDPAKKGTIISARVNGKEMNNYVVVKDGYYTLSVIAKEGEIIDIYVNNKRSASAIFSTGAVESLTLNSKSFPAVYMIALISLIVIGGYFIAKFFAKNKKRIVR
ncbi:MAG: hypothetical protein AABY14_04525 [Nanoarchaeota archaeon]